VGTPSSDGGAPIESSVIEIWSNGAYVDTITAGPAATTTAARAYVYGNYEVRVGAA
jgi:hypothetical protein